MCNEVSGNLGQALRAHLAANGTKMPSKQVLRDEVQKLWHPYETGKIVIDDPKKPGKVSPRPASRSPPCDPSTPQPARA